MNRLKIAAGNWKMNTTLEDAVALAKDYKNGSRANNVISILGVPFPFMHAVLAELEGSDVHVAAQNCSEHDKGAFTGETSVSMIKSIGANYIIIGHSERREYFGESDALLAAKLTKCLKAGLTPIFCCGEPLQVRKAGTQVDYVKSQLKNALSHLSTPDLEKLIIAYEPIWAIGTGETATPQQAQDMHKALREYLEELFSIEIASHIPILYGGSVKPANAKELFACEDVDGGLVGGASLKADSFLAINNSF